MKPFSAGPGKNRGLPRRRILDARDDGGALRRLCSGFSGKNRLQRFAEEEITWRELDEFTDRIAANLIARGIERDARALVQMASSNREMVLRIAFKKAGILGCFAPMQWRRKELDYACRELGPSLIFASPEAGGEEPTHMAG